MPVMLTVRRLRQEDLQLQASLNYISIPLSDIFQLGQKYELRFLLED
jgi:hypothetical protein